MALPGLPRGVEEDLPADGGSRVNVLRRGLALHVGHELDVNTAILRPSFGRAVAGNFFIFAESGDVNLVSRNVVLGREVLNDCRGSHLAELVVVLCAANGIGSTLELDYVSFGVWNVVAELIQRLFCLLAEHRAVKCEVN